MIFEKIRERLQKQAERYQESIERQHCIDARWIEEEGLQATEEAIDIINQVEAEYNNDMVYQLAMKYALCLTQYGVDITEKLETATQNVMALEQAYIRGRQDECDRFSEWRDRHNNGWISVDDRLPEPYKKVLVLEENGEIHLCRYHNESTRFYYDGSDWDIKLSCVTHWRELPQPPKGE